MRDRGVGDKCAAGDLDAEVIAADFEHAVVRESDGAVEAVEDLLSLSAVGDHVVDAEEAEVMAHRGLGEFELLADGGDVSLALGEREKDVYAGFVREKTEEEDKTIEVLVQRRGVQQRHTDSCIRSWRLVWKLIAAGEVILT
jgi:hypothetical protein